jgi:hypothetical protein
MTMKLTPAARWQPLHASVSLTKALAEPSLLSASIARRRSVTGGALSCLMGSANGGMRELEMRKLVVVMIFAASAWRDR